MARTPAWARAPEIASPALSPNAQAVLAARYLSKDASGRIVETPEGMFRRVARTIAAVDRSYDGAAAADRWEETYFRVMADLAFLPNSPTLMNAGTELNQLAACFVLPVGDSIPEIFGAVRDMAVVHQSGGGTGFAFSRLRPCGDVVGETGGVASGPVSFMRVFDVATDVIKQGGRRRGANMGVLAVSHPDVLAFVRAKTDPTLLTNFNLSLAIPDAFMQAVQAGHAWQLVNPRTGQVTGTVDARELWQAVCESAWQCGDPGVLFIDEIERYNPTPALGRFEATNPCGEQPLLAHEACNLGSINLARCVVAGSFDWPRLGELVGVAVRFLDGVIDAGAYPLPEVQRMTLTTRKIGLGIMGLADALILLRVPYASDEAVRLARQVMEFVSRAARKASAELAERRGPFPAYATSIWPGRGFPPLRNATVTTVAPTGTLSLIAGTSSGIEPLFGVAFTRTILDGTEMSEINPLFVAALEREGLDAAAIVAEVAATGSAQQVASLPPDLRELFRTALEIAPAQHIRVQAAVQAATDNAVSKTINLPASASVQDVRLAFELAWVLRCKGATVFRYGSREGQTLTVGKVPSYVAGPGRARADSEYAGECRLCSV